HVGMGSLSNVPPLIEYLQALGSNNICNSGLVQWHERSADDYRQAAKILNEAGHAFLDAGINLHYHHHEFEFEKVEGDKTGLDILMGETDSAAVDLCVDIAWVQKGGSSPAEFLQKHQDRITYLHFKDYNADGWTELGSGEVDIASVMQVLPTLPRIRWVMVEQDTTNLDPLESLAISRRYLRDTFGY
ncbi:MAG: sugar phosphate isomerase/epimerase family protein, partial [Janthinobacterium lividum]